MTWPPATFVTTIPTADPDAIRTSFTVPSSIQLATKPATQQATQSATPLGITTSSTVAGIPTSTPKGIADNHKGRSQITVAIGVGLGVPLSIMSLGWFGFLVWRERRRRPVHTVVHGDPLPIPSLQNNNTSSDERCHEIDGNLVLPELPVER